MAIIQKITSSVVQDVKIDILSARPSFSSSQEPQADNVLVAGRGLFALNGQDVNFIRQTKFPASNGSFSLSGQDVNFTRQTVMSAAQGSFALNGQDVSFVTGGSQQDETETLLAAMSSQPSSEQAGEIDTLIAALKTAGVWSKLDRFFMFHSHHSQAATLDWKDPTRNITLVNSPTYGNYSGYTPALTGTKYISTNFNPSSSGVQFTGGANSVGLGWVSGGANQDKFDLQVDTSGTAGSLPWQLDIGSELLVRNSGTTSNSQINVTDSAFGRFICTKVSTNGTRTLFKNNSSLGTRTVTEGSTNTNGVVRIGSGMNSRLYNFFFIGNYLDSTEVAAIDSALSTFITNFTA